MPQNGDQQNGFCLQQFSQFATIKISDGFALRSVQNSDEFQTITQHITTRTLKPPFSLMIRISLLSNQK